MNNVFNKLNALMGCILFQKMPTLYKRKEGTRRGERSQENLIKAPNAVKENTMGVNEAAKAFSIPKTTLKRRLKKQSFEKGPLGPTSVLGVEVENKLVTHIKKLQSVGFTPCRDFGPWPTNCLLYTSRCV